MDWQTATLLGAVGGLIVELLPAREYIVAWGKARHNARAKDKPLPKLTRYIDPAADVLALLTRTMLGALAGWLFRHQVTGELAAVMIGASAPAILLQLGNAKSLGAALQHAEVTSGQLPVAPEATADAPAAHEARP